MSVKSSMILDKNGKIILSRQFCQVTKQNLEEWGRNLPKLICKRQQHTFIEDQNIRYIYQKLEEIYLVLIVSKESNMIEDMEILKTIHKVIIELLNNQTMNEENILKNGIDILLSFDDILINGYRQNTSVQQVIQQIQMESAEEKLHDMLMKARQQEAKEQAKKYQQEQEKKRKAEAASGITNLNKVINDPYLLNTNNTNNINNNSSINNNNNNTNKISNINNNYSIQENQILNSQQQQSSVKGLQLGKKVKQVQKNEERMEMEKELEKQEKIVKVNQQQQEQQQKQQQKQQKVWDISIMQCEKVSCTINKEGELENLTINGDVNIQQCSEDKLGIQLNKNMLNKLTLYKVKPHPSLNKQLFLSNAQLQNKDHNIPFPNNFSALKYQISSKNEQDIPFRITYWPTDSGFTLEIEYNSSQTFFTQFHNLTFIIEGEDSKVISVENSDYKNENGQINWIINKLDSINCSASIEVNINGNVIFPIQVSFERKQTIYDLKVESIYNSLDGNNLEHLLVDFQQNIKTFNFNIVDNS